MLLVLFLTNLHATPVFQVNFQVKNILADGRFAEIIQWLSLLVYFVAKLSR